MLEIDSVQIFCMPNFSGKINLHIELTLTPNFLNICRIIHVSLTLCVCIFIISTLHKDHLTLVARD